MKRLMTLGITITASIALAACGGGAGNGAGASTAAGTGSGTVAVRQLSAVGSVLVDHTGKALYSSDLEASGTIVCDAACNAFWKPLAAGPGKPTASVGAGKLGVITRPDGSRQVTADGKPLYTFAEDSPGKATGNGFTDDFNGHHFTWIVVHPGGTTTGASGPSRSAGAPSGSGGSGSSYGSGGSSSSGSNYGY